MVDVVCPPACLLCHQPLDRGAGDDRAIGRAMCDPCVRAMPAITLPWCQRCGLSLDGPYDAALLCRACRTSQPIYAQAVAVWQYRGMVPHAIRQFKYHHRRRIGQWLGDAMAEAACQRLPIREIDGLVPVPLHWWKRRLRGCNPSALLAHALGTALEKPVLEHAVSRKRWTRSQTGLSSTQRWRNVQHAFTAHPTAVRRAAILLVDDVLTSGATVSACAQALRDGGARAVYVLTAARTLSPHAERRGSA